MKCIYCLEEREEYITGLCVECAMKMDKELGYHLLNQQKKQFNKNAIQLIKFIKKALSYSHEKGEENEIIDKVASELLIFTDYDKISNVNKEGYSRNLCGDGK